ncbi:YebC/PmpR family DNA-binding transcriptional regulator [bacterium]|nr:YebC/PmpR family DNA-binding transcriptional regulator [bacterium]
MSGHSKWSTIKHKKAATDARRANVFTKLGRLISVAAKRGGNPNANLKLKLAIDQARAVNMPKDNIERAIKRGTGELKDQANIEEIIYEAFGPGGIMMVIKTLTDNKNRTVSEIKTILGKFSGKLGGIGSVMWNFEISESGYKPKNIMKVDKVESQKFASLREALEEQDDVQKVFDNL